MTEDSGGLREELGKILAKSQRMLLAAETALQDEFFETAASRAYYTVFHAI